MIVEPTPLDASTKAAEILKECITQAIDQHGQANVVLAGGTTPRSAYQRLAEQAAYDNVNWSQVSFFIGDERDVPQDDVESNYGTAQRTLMDHLPIDWSKVHPMRADAEDLDAAAAEYEQTVRQHVPAGPEGIPQFDLIMLGMGGDGHTASLFPDSSALDEWDKLITAVHVPVLGRHRMTMTFPLINAARNILMLITGDDKAKAVHDVFQQRDPSLPASRLEVKHGTIHVVLDEAAARLI
jgi:6-phosphogluconolactonase